MPQSRSRRFSSLATVNADSDAGRAREPRRPGRAAMDDCDETMDSLMHSTRDIMIHNHRALVFLLATGRAEVLVD